jgi:hypothetical protein
MESKYNEKEPNSEKKNCTKAYCEDHAIKGKRKTTKKNCTKCASLRSAVYRTRKVSLYFNLFLIVAVQTKRNKQQ